MKEKRQQNSSPLPPRSRSRPCRVLSSSCELFLFMWVKEGIIFKRRTKNERKKIGNDLTSPLLTPLPIVVIANGYSEVKIT